MVLPDGTEVWIDGGPRGDSASLDLGPIVHTESVSDGELHPEPSDVPRPGDAGLAADQLEAVMHGVGAARVIAPAGSGKTRTLVARLRHMVDDLAIPARSITAVAYNTRAAREMSERVGPGLSRSVRTIHSLGRAILLDARGNLELMSEADVRRALDPMVQAARRPNTDVIGPYIEALSEVRIALRSPDDVEAARDDVPGFAQVFSLYRERLASRRAHDFDEQIFGAVEALLEDPELRRRWQAQCRHLLVDEFQDLTPAYLLLIRLLGSPALDVFGVGDDDQVIYGYAGADPRYLIDFDRLFPGAGHHALEVNHRCPKPVVDAAVNLLAHNRIRIDKVIRSTDTGSEGFEVRTPASEATVPAVVEAVRDWLATGVDPTEIVVLCRVNSALLPVHAGFIEAAIPMQSPITPSVLDRTVLSAALAWMRIGLDPEQISRSDLMSAIRRPSRGLTRIAGDLLGRQRSVSRALLRELRTTLDGRRRDRWESFCSDIDLVVKASASGDSRAVIETLISDVGLDRAANALDAGRTRADRSGQSDDLRALERIAHLHEDLADFEPWLRGAARRSTDTDGVLLTTVHRVKGLEWNRVILYGADRGLMPHDLATDREEERRVFHVAMTRSRQMTLVVADSARPSRFVAEAEGKAPIVTEPEPAPARGGQRSGGVVVAVGDRIELSGGFAGVVERELPIGVLVALEPGPGRLSVKWGESVAIGGVTGPIRPGDVGADQRLMEVLKRWRLETARAQGVPAFVVLTDASLEELARRRPRSEGELLSVKGIGPARLDAYGDDLLALLADEVDG